MKNAKDFMEDIKGNTELAMELQKYINESECKSDEDAFEATARFARKNGYEAEAEDLSLAIARTRSLSDDELDSIAGGGQTCFSDYSCYYVYKHDTDSSEACTNDYACFQVFFCPCIAPADPHNRY